MAETEKQDLLNEIQQERDRICELLHEDISRNAPRPFLPPLEKYRILDEALKESLQSDAFSSADQPQIILERLKRESKLLKKDLAVEAGKVNYIIQESQRIMEFIKQIEEKKQSALKLKPERDWSKINQNIKRRFLVEKSKLKKVLEKILPDDEESLSLMSDIINRALTTHEYLDLEDREGTSERIQFLVESQFFELNPDNPLQIRLVKLY